MPNCENGVGIGCNSNWPGTNAGSSVFNLGTSPISQTPMHGSTPNLVSNDLKPNGFTSVFPTVLDSVSSAFVDVYGVLNGIPQGPDNVTYVLPPAEREKEAGAKSGASTIYLVLLVGVILVAGMYFFMASKSKK